MVYTIIILLKYETNLHMYVEVAKYSLFKKSIPESKII